jgi:FAD/FMN-containing dehydrogenase
VILNQPGSGWGRLAEYVAGTIPTPEVDAVWQFRTIRREGREFGTAVLARVEGEGRERRRIYTARFVHVLKGKERGKFEAFLEEVGSGPVEALGDLLAGVRKRLEDEDPRPVPVADWFPVVDAAARDG